MGPWTFPKIHYEDTQWINLHAIWQLAVHALLESNQAYVLMQTFQILLLQWRWNENCYVFPKNPEHLGNYLMSI